MPRCNLERKTYTRASEHAVVDVDHIRNQLIYLLMRGRVTDALEFDVNEIERNLACLRLPARWRELVEEQLVEYRTDGKLKLWDETEFPKLARILVEILGVRVQVEGAALASRDNEMMTEQLCAIATRLGVCVSKKFTIALSQGFMKDFELGKNDSEKRRDIYRQWVDFMVAKRGWDNARGSI